MISDVPFAAGIMFMHAKEHILAQQTDTMACCRYTADIYIVEQDE